MCQPAAIVSVTWTGHWILKSSSTNMHKLTNRRWGHPSQGHKIYKKDTKWKYAIGMLLSLMTSDIDGVGKRWMKITDQQNPSHPGLHN